MLSLWKPVALWQGALQIDPNPEGMREQVYDKAVEVLSQLNEHGVDYKVIGGIALIVQGVVRATEDLDIFIRPDRENVERLKRALRAVWNDPCIDEISYDDLAGDYPSLAYGPPDASLALDILVRLGETVSWDNVEVERKSFGPVDIPVATARMLVRMKRNTVRLKDRADAEMLAELHGLEEERR